MPLGMKNHKKVSDFLIDEKVPTIEKEGTTVLVTGDDIIWIVGMRIADPCKVGSRTKQVLVIEAINKKA
jgi:tRNA(Ile)-lysidine synthase